MASYQYEQLNDESFQELSQSLLLREYPGLQCFPVGQRDGGRDAIVRVYKDSPSHSGFILFQVKFTRRKLDPSDARDWLSATLKDELPKVKTQMQEGAERFVLITNVPGTAHFGGGSIDKLQVLLQDEIPIPAQAWWREDLDRRLDQAWDLKLHYSLLSGPDLLRLVIESSPSEHRDRRRHAITSFLAHQFETDREVKFKQVELENDIFDLFTDVPVVPRHPAERKQRETERLAAAFQRAARSPSDSDRSASVRYWLEIASLGETDFGRYHPRGETWLGTASLLLDSDFQQAEPLVILEGAPGQGKSTIGQYICQVHRTRLLGRQHDDAADQRHFGSSLRIPFKVELRDFATWLSGGNAFGSISDGGMRSYAPKSLESFISDLVRHGSGGADFDVSDLLAILSSSPSLIVLDGLDEVAEISQRQRVVEEIISAIPRLRDVCLSLQVVVTSRPTLFTNSPVLPRRYFSTYSLQSLARPLIVEYTDRWLRSRGIDETDAKDVREILDNKLDEPHLRDLARNPMQLAILLSLIHRRGVSLPDKRTSLYDSYIDMFFDRESEKATVVKENRELLIRIHRYLAWVLQSDAEVASNSASLARSTGTTLSGTITEEDLKTLVREFLENEGSDSTLVDKLFSGMVERVVAIVSRVQGTYEFDVQTLREYFAARHLYETAPYSPPGDQRRGTRSERWRALTRNFYWLNVARFYAGCYSEGELPSLIDELVELSNDELFRSTSHPQVLTAALVGDWVFSQRPRAVRDAVDLLLESRGLRMLIGGEASGPRHAAEVIVRDPAGRQRLIAVCKDLIGPERPIEQVMEVVLSVLRQNSDPEELLEWWIEHLRSTDNAHVGRWCTLGDLLNCWSIIDRAAVDELLDLDKISTSWVITGLLHADRMDILESTEELFEAAVDAVLDGAWIGRAGRGSLLQRLIGSLRRAYLSNYSALSERAMQLTLSTYWSEIDGADDDIGGPDYPASERCTRLLAAFATAAERPLTEWTNSIEPWDQILQPGISEFGECTSFVELANVAAGIRSTEEQCQDSPDLFDTSRSLVRRFRYARLRAGSRKWWAEQLRSAIDASEVPKTLLIFATWASARTIEELADTFDKLVVDLSEQEWRNLHASLSRVIRINSGRPWIKASRISVGELPQSLDLRTVALLAERCTQATVDELYERYLTGYRGEETIIASLRTDVEIRRAISGKTKWSQAIDSLRWSYALGAPTFRSLPPHQIRGLSLPDSVTKEIVDQPLAFPGDLVRVAEARCRQANARSILPLAQVAVDEGWFTD